MYIAKNDDQEHFFAGQDQLDEINLWSGDSQTLVNAFEMIPNPFCLLLDP